MQRRDYYSCSDAVLHCYRIIQSDNANHVPHLQAKPCHALCRTPDEPPSQHRKSHAMHIPSGINKSWHPSIRSLRKLFIAVRPFG